MLNSPSSLKCTPLKNKPKLATIHELPPLFRLSKSTTEINNRDRFESQFDDDFKVRTTEDADSSSEIGFSLRQENSGVHCPPLEKSFFCNEQLPTSGSENQMSVQEDDPFPPKSPVNFKRCKQAKELAVDCRNISYQYGHGRKANKVLNDVTLKVPLGGIYGLLGPSGCGMFSLSLF